jgi:hypothetical protein
MFGLGPRSLKDWVALWGCGLAIFVTPFILASIPSARAAIENAMPPVLPRCVKSHQESRHHGWKISGATNCGPGCIAPVFDMPGWRMETVCDEREGPRVPALRTPDGRLWEDTPDAREDFRARGTPVESTWGRRILRVYE